MNLDEKFFWVPFFGYLAALWEEDENHMWFLTYAVMLAGFISAFFFQASTLTVGLLLILTGLGTIVEACIRCKIPLRLFNWEKLDFVTAAHEFSWNNYQEVSIFLVPYILVSVLLVHLV